MHPLYRLQILQRKHQKPRLDTHVADDTPERADAPIPWSIVNDFSHLATIIDANGVTVAICLPAHAERIIAAVNAAVNGAEKAS